MILAHNMLADFTERQLNINNKSKNKALEKLSTGYKVNRAADDAAGLAVSEKMRAQIRGLNRGAQNVQEGIDFCNTADGALGEVHSILDRIKELSVQAANDTNVTADREAINMEISVLKKEINRISCHTEYNTYPIFATPFAVDFSDDINVIQIFNANTGNYPVDPYDPNSYGGIIVNSISGEDTRVSWDSIDPDMVYKDPVTGETRFNAGTYTYDTGLCILTFECKDGTKPPEIKTSFPVEGTADGIRIGGTLVTWKDILNEDDESILDHVGEGGYYHFNIGKGEGVFYVPDFDSLNDISKGINACNKRYHRKYINEYDGFYTSKAVDVTDTGSNMKVTNNIFQALVNKDDLDIRLKADDQGIWLVKINSDRTDGAVLPDSKMSWNAVGIDINAWDSGNDISDQKTYHYTYQKDEYDIQFNFSLIDETGIDSVIAGINNASVMDTKVTTNDALALDFSNNNPNQTGILSGIMKRENPNISIYQEAALDRDFDLDIQNIASEALNYNSSTNRFSLEYKDGYGNTQVSYASTQVTNLNTLKKNAEVAEDFLVAKQIQHILSGDSVNTLSLNEVIHDDKITQNKQVFLDPLSMTHISNGLTNGGVYNVAEIDFSGLGTDYDWYDLLGTGFNSTCATCSNHYSIMFVYGGTTFNTADGYGYSRTNDGRSNYLLEIDLKSLLDKGVDSGSELSEAIVDVIKESGFDFHYQQYVADGDKLYVCDNRMSALGSFDTKPYEVDNCVIDVAMSGDGTFALQYTYDLKHNLNPLANMSAPNTTGEWVSDGNGGYKKYDYWDYHYPDGSLIPPGEPDRYDINIGGTVTSWEDYYDEVMQNIADNSTVQLNSTDYDYVAYRADENDNSAVVSTFDFYVEDTRAFWIQGGSNSNQGINLDWDGFSTYTLGIGRGNTLTWEASEELLGKVDKAIESISLLRSVFGAYTNRMEHFYENDTNTSENLQYAESEIRDADMAEEMVNFSAKSIILQAGQAMLTQANQSKDGILTLLR